MGGFAWRLDDAGRLDSRLRGNDGGREVAMKHEEPKYGEAPGFLSIDPPARIVVQKSHE